MSLSKRLRRDVWPPLGAPDHVDGEVKLVRSLAALSEPSTGVPS